MHLNVLVGSSGLACCIVVLQLFPSEPNKVLQVCCYFLIIFVLCGLAYGVSFWGYLRLLSWLLGGSIGLGVWLSHGCVIQSCGLS